MSAVEVFECNDCGNHFYTEGMANSIECWDCAGLPESAEGYAEDVTTCGTCGRSWDDTAITDVTPTPSGRCPFEYEHTSQCAIVGTHDDERTDAMSDTDKTYNGWTNRETWAVMLYINNDQGLQSEAHEKAVDHLNLRGEDAPVWKLGDDLREWIDDLFSYSYWHEDLGCEMPEDVHLMRNDVGSTWRVNWEEVAESIKGDVFESWTADDEDEEES